MYRVSVTYEGRYPQQSGQGDMPMSPLAEPPVISWFHAASNEPIDTDVNGSPILNSALESYDPPMTEDFYDVVLRVERNEMTYNRAMAADYAGAVNSDTWLGYGPGHARCRVFTGNKAYTNFWAYFRVIYEFQMRYSEVRTRDPGGTIVTRVIGWLRRMRDEGYRELTGATLADGSPEVRTIVDKEGSPISQPQPLDGSGTKLTKSVIDNVPLPESAFLTFDTIKQRPFAILGIQV